MSVCPFNSSLSLTCKSSSAVSISLFIFLFSWSVKCKKSFNAFLLKIVFPTATASQYILLELKNKNKQLRRDYTNNRLVFFFFFFFSFSTFLYLRKCGFEKGFLVVTRSILLILLYYLNIFVSKHFSWWLVFFSWNVFLIFNERLKL